MSIPSWSRGKEFCFDAGLLETVGGPVWRFSSEDGPSIRLSEKPYDGLETFPTLKL